MSILIDENTRVIVQGITGNMARIDVKLNLEQGVKIVAGVTPGKGGERVHGVPVYDTVRQAMAETPADASVVYVPARAAKDAIIEAVDGGVKLILVFGENIPQHDFIYCLSYAGKRRVRIIGPNSNGIISPGKSRLGGLGGDNPERMFIPGPVGVISRSGGMAGEISWMLRSEGIGISTCVSMGGDRIVGTTIRDLLELFEEDDETEAVVLFGEVGGGFEEEAAEFVAAGSFSKPLVAFIAGKFIDEMPEGVSFGHSGTLIEDGAGSALSKTNAFKQAGIEVANSLIQIPALVKKTLQGPLVRGR